MTRRTAPAPGEAMIQLPYQGSTALCSRAGWASLDTGNSLVSEKCCIFLSLRLKGILWLKDYDTKKCLEDPSEYYEYILRSISYIF